MTWLPLTDLLLEAHTGRQVALEPALDHAKLRERALRLAAALQARGVQRVALYLEDAAELAIALLGAWRAGVQVLLPADAQAQTRQRLAAQVDLWLDDLAGLDAEALPAAALAPEHCRLTLCTSGSSGEPKLIDKSLAQTGQRGRGAGALVGSEPRPGDHPRQRRLPAYLRPAVPPAVAAVRRPSPVSPRLALPRGSAAHQPGYRQGWCKRSERRGCKARRSEAAEFTGGK